MTDKDCSKCSTTCLECKPKFHRDMQTRRYNDVPGGLMLIPNRLCVKLMNDNRLDAETRAELRDWYVSS